MPKKTKEPKAAPSEAETKAHAHGANPPHNHGPAATPKPMGFSQKFGGSKPPRPPAPKMIVRGANRGR